MHQGKWFVLSQTLGNWRTLRKTRTHAWSWSARRLDISALNRSLVLAAILLGDLLLVPGKVGAVESHRSTTSDSARQEAIQAIPLAKLTARHRQQVRAVIEHATLYRRLPTCVVDCHPGLFTYVARNPEVLVAIWRELGVTQVELHRTGLDRFDFHDQSGTSGKLVLVEQQCDENAQNRLVLLAEGSYENKPMTRPVKAQCVLLLRSGSILETNGRRYVAARLDSFVHVDRAGLQLFAKVIHPWVGITADRNFSDTLTFISHLSHTAEVRPEKIGKLASKLAGIPPVRRQQLVRIANECAHDSHQWQLDQQSRNEFSRAQLARFTEAKNNTGKEDGVTE